MFFNTIRDETSNDYLKIYCCLNVEPTPSNLIELLIFVNDGPVLKSYTDN